MMSEILVEHGKKKVKLVKDEYGLYLTTMINGFQWHSIPVDYEILGMIEEVINKHELSGKS